VLLGLIGHRDGEGGAAVAVAGDVEPAEPGQPVVVEMAVDADRVLRGGAVHDLDGTIAIAAHNFIFLQL